MHYVEFDEGQDIIKIGEIGDSFYLLFEGEIDSKCTYFGVESFLNLPYLYSIKSITKTRLATISKHDFQII
jgi:cGMP-dependent protein kinase 2